MRNTAFMKNLSDRQVDTYFSTQISFFIAYWTVLLASFFIFNNVLKEAYYIPCFILVSLGVNAMYYRKIKYLDFYFIITLMLTGYISGMTSLFAIFSVLYLFAVAPFYCCKLYSYLSFNWNAKPIRANNTNIFKYYVDKISHWWHRGYQKDIKEINEKSEITLNAINESGEKIINELQQTTIDESKKVISQTEKVIIGSGRISKSDIKEINEKSESVMQKIAEEGKQTSKLVASHLEKQHRKTRDLLKKVILKNEIPWFNGTVDFKLSKHENQQDDIIIITLENEILSFTIRESDCIANALFNTIKKSAYFTEKYNLTSKVPKRETNSYRLANRVREKLEQEGISYGEILKTISGDGYEFSIDLKKTTIDSAIFKLFFK